MLNYKRLAPRSTDPKVYTHNNEKITHQEADMINNGTFIEGETSVPGEYITAQEVVQKLAAQHKHVNYMIGGDELNELVCYYTWSKEEEFPEEWTYVFQYNISDTNGGSSTDTSWSRQYYANGQEIKHADDLTLNGITSYRTKTGTLGTIKREDVKYSGEIGRPSGYNYSDQAITQSGQLVQQGSNKQLQWSYTQEANVKVWGISADPTSLHFEAAGGMQSVSVTTWYTWQTNDNNNQKFGETTTEEQITAEANTSTQQKEWTETITKNGKSVSINCTQDGKHVVLNVKYHLYVGLSADNINDNTVSLVWRSDQYGESSKKTVYVKAYKEVTNESNQVVSTEAVDYSITSYASQNKFSVNKNNTLVDFYPLEENADYSSSKQCSFRVSIPGQNNKFCTISLIQERKGIQIISGDAVMFTYNWDKGRDLDQATFINLNLKADRYDNYAGFQGIIINEYKNILYFAGDNMGKGNEYAFIDFKNIAKYLNEHKDDQSSIAGKTILQSLIDNNGVISIQCHLYTNWYREKETENITLSYSVYNKDSEDATVKATDDKTFILTGYTKIKDQSEPALCYANGIRNTKYGVNVKDGYTLSAKFTYYLDSGVFAFDTNKNNVGKWHKGAVLSPVECNPSYSNVQFTNDGKNINFSISIDSIGQPNYFDKNSIVYIKPRIQQKGGLNYNYTMIDSYRTQINQLPYKIESSTPLTDVIKDMNFDKSNTVIPRVVFECVANNYTEEKYAEINTIELEQNVLTIQKQSD